MTAQKNEYDQRQGADTAPARETPDFAALVKKFQKWDATELEVIWNRNDEITTIADFLYFLTYATQANLDPILGEVVASARWNAIKRRRIVTPIVTIGVLRKRRAEFCDGIGEPKFEYGANQKIPKSVSGVIYRKGAANPFHATIYFEEYAPLDNQGLVVALWQAKPHMFMLKCLEAQLTRIAFFDKCGEMLIDEELQRNEPAVEPTGSAVDEFAVGEKEVAPGVATALSVLADAGIMPLSETKLPAPAAPAAETKPPAAETKPPAAETKPPAAETKPLAAEPAPVPLFSLWVIQPDGKKLSTATKPMPREAAVIAAREMAAQRKAPVAIEDGDGKEVDRIAPPTPAPAPKPEAAKPAAHPEFDAMVSLADSKIGGEPTAAHKLIGSYFKGYLNVQTVPKNAVKLTEPLQKLLAVLDARLADLKADPEALGVELSGRQTSKLDEEFKRLDWPVNIRALARRVMTLAGHNERNFIDWLHLPAVGSGPTSLTIAQMDVKALGVLFPLYLLVRGKAFQALDFAIARQRNITETLLELEVAAGSPVDKWTVKFAEKVLSTLATLDMSEQPAPPVEEDPFNVGLPFE